MIVPMKKVTLLVLDSKRDEELRALKRLGVLHPQIEQRRDQVTEELLERRELLQRALVELATVESLPLGDSVDQAKSAPEDGSAVPEARAAAETAATASDPQRHRNALLARAESIAGRIAEQSDKIRSLQETIDRLERERTRILPWGNFDPDQIRAFRDRGIHLRLCTMTPKEFKKRGPTGAVTLEATKTTVRFAVLTPEGSEELDTLREAGAASELELPEDGIQSVDAQIAANHHQLRDERMQLATSLPQRQLLEAALDTLDERLHDHGVYLGMDSADRIAYIAGFAPESRLEALRAAAAENGWGLLIRDPPPEEPAPTQIRNPRWITIIRPIFEMLGVVPGYRERDISLPFLAFFTVFVGMIIGDAGYGSLIFLGSLGMIIATKARGRQVSQFLKLALVLGLSVIIWGAITGNWFGYHAIAQAPPFSFFVIDQLDTAAAESGQIVQFICFTLAVVHLSLAHLWSFLVFLTRKPAIKAIGEIGWLGVVIGLYFLVLNLFLDVPLPAFALPAIFAGLGLVFVFAEQRADRGFFRTILYSFTEGLLPTIFSGISAFSDVISYIRLYAIGIASVEIAQAFNEMAAGSGIIGGIIILMLGHSLNLIMGGLAVIVHGVRLNVLEFAGHLGMEWTGFAYTPFAETGHRR